MEINLRFDSEIGGDCMKVAELERVVFDKVVLYAAINICNEGLRLLSI